MRPGPGSAYYSWEASVLERRAMWPIDALLGLLVFVGVSSSISPWFADLYSGIAWPWGVGAGVIAVAIWAVKEFGPDLELESELRAADRQNAAAVAALEAKHAAHPEVAKELAARMLAEKLARMQAEGQPPPTAKG